MNDTCPTTAQSNDSPLPSQEDSGCQPSDVPLRRADARVRFCFQGHALFAAACVCFSVIVPDVRAFPSRSRTSRPLPCGMACFPA